MTGLGSAIRDGRFPGEVSSSGDFPPELPIQPKIGNDFPVQDKEFEGKRLIMVGGKGGVGKTTCSAALAFHFARSGQKTLLISSDPTPSLSDIFETGIGDREKKIPGAKNLYGLEISSEAVLQRWKERFGPEIHEVLSAFSSVDYDFVDYIGGAPGIEEEYMLNAIMELVESGKYDRVVWDTAPAGHTLRLLHLPQLFLNHLEAAARFYLNLYGAFERVASTVRLKKSKRTILQIIEGWKELSQEVLNFIRDPGRTGYVVVTIAEALGVSLTERLVHDFDAYQLTVSHLIVNHLVLEADCDFHRRRRVMQQKYLNILRERYELRMTLVEIPLLSHEVRGVERITEVADMLFPPPGRPSRPFHPQAGNHEII
jgi:arsenite-transporting ATPase